MNEGRKEIKKEGRQEGRKAGRKEGRKEEARGFRVIHRLLNRQRYHFA